MSEVFGGAALLVGQALVYSALVFGAFVVVALAGAVVAWRRRWFDCAPGAGPWAPVLLASAWVLGTLLVGAITAPQVGAMHAVALSVDDVATTLIADGLVEVGAPLGIARADEPIDLARYAGLADRLVANASATGAGSGDWTARFWTLAADGVRLALRHYAADARVTPRDVATWAWAHSARPAVRAFVHEAIVVDAIAAGAALGALGALLLGVAWAVRRRATIGPAAPS